MLSEESDRVDAKFKLMGDVVAGTCIDDESCVWPVYGANQQIVLMI